MANFVKDKTIKYLNKDFRGFVRDLQKYGDAHHSGVFVDKNESSPGMALLELNAYVGDVLSFYIDQQFNELKMETARQEKNVVSIAKQLGYRPRGPRAAQGKVHWIVEVPASTNASGETVPNELYVPILRRGARAVAQNGTSFETLEDVYFSSSIDREVTGSQFDSTTGLPTYFAMRKSVDCIAGQTHEDSFTIVDFEQFKTLTLTEDNVIEIISVTDSDGYEWIEVDYLSQDTVFDYDVNDGDDSEDVPYVLKLMDVPRRFVTDRSPTTGLTSLIFGSGDGVSFDDQLVPNLADFALPLAGRRTYTSYPLDPQNFLKTMTLGMSPFNTTITVQYRTGGGSETNVARGAINRVSLANVDFASTGLNAQLMSSIERSIECINLNPTTGGAPAETISEIKANSAAFFSAQDRCVTKQDFIARVLSIPEKFGKPEKVFIRRSGAGTNSVDIHVLTKDENGHMAIATSNLKKNIKTYLSKYRMVTDSINILNANIINIRIGFGVVVSPKYSRSEVLVKCLSTIEDYFDIDRWQIGQPIIISDVISEIQNIVGVISVYSMEVKSVANTSQGNVYSSISYDIRSHTKNNIVYCPDNAIFEIKYPRKDIVGTAK